MPTFFLMHIPQDAALTKKIATELVQLGQFEVGLNAEGDLTQITGSILHADVIGIVVSHQALCTPEIHDGFVKARTHKKRIIFLLVETLDKRLLFNEWEDFDFEQTAQQNWRLFKRYMWTDFRNPREFFFDIKKLNKTLGANFVSHYLRNHLGWKPTRTQPALRIAFILALILFVAALGIAILALNQTDEALRAKHNTEQELAEVRTAQAETYAPLATQFANQQNQGVLISDLQLTQQALMNESASAYQQGETVRHVLWANFAQDALAEGHLDVALPLALATYRQGVTPVPEVIDTLNTIAQHPLPQPYFANNPYPNAHWAVSPDASTLVAVTEDEAGLHIAVHQVTNEDEASSTISDFGAISQLIFSPDNQHILLMAETNELLVWDVVNGVEVQRLATNQRIAEAQFTADGRYLVTGGSNTENAGEIIQWNITTGDIETRLMGTADQAITQLALHPNNQTFMVVYGESDVAFGSFDDDVLPPNIIETGNLIGDITFTADGLRPISAECSQLEGYCQIMLWDDGLVERYAYARLEFMVRQMVSSSDSRDLYVAGCRGQCMLAQINLGLGGIQLAQSPIFLENPQIAVHPTANTVLTVSDSGEPTRWQIMSKPHHYDLVDAEAVAFSPNGDQYIAAQSDGNLTVHDAQTGQVKESFTGGQVNNITHLTYSADGTRLVTVGRNEPIKLWDVITHEFIREFAEYRGEIDHLAISRDRQMIIASTESRDILLWDATTGELVYEVEAHHNPIQAVAISDDHNWGISATKGETFVWDLITHRLMRNIQVNGIVDIKFMPNEWAFILVTQSGEINWWHVQSQAVTMTQQLNRATHWEIGFLENSKQVVFASAEEVLIWDSAFDMFYPAAVQIPTQAIMERMEMSYRNDRLWMVDEDGHAYLWQVLLPDDLIQAFYDNTTIRELTCEERVKYYFEPSCQQDIYPTRTPFRATASFTPTNTPSPTATATATLDPSSPTVTPSPSSTLFEIPTVTLAPTYTPSLSPTPEPTETLPVISAFALD